jgi:hypothetical protein
VHQWEALLSAMAEHATELARLEPQRAALAESLEKARQAKALQDSHRAGKQRTTQTLKEIIAEGKERAIRLRGAIRGEMGTSTEQLVQFGIQPIRRRASRAKQGGTPAPTPTPAPQPEAPGTTAKGAQ